MSVVGSQNYGTAVEGSDTDIKVAYLPTFEEFYRNSFAHTDTGSPDSLVDYTLHPVHEFLRHAFKGNMNFWEVFFSDSLEFNPNFVEGKLFAQLARNVVVDSPMYNFNAMRGMAIQKDKQAYRNYKSDKADFYKSAQHAMRMLDTIMTYQACGSLYLNLLDLPTHHRIEWADWRKDQTLTIQEYADAFEMKLKMVDNLEDIFKEHHTNTDVRSNRERCRESLDSWLIRLVKETS